MKRGTPVWGRREGESDGDWEAFESYLDMGPTRSLMKLSGELNKDGFSYATLSRRCRESDWVERARAYDNEELAKHIGGREKVREVVRQTLIDNCAEAANIIMDLARNEETPATVRLHAAKAVIGLSGIVQPRRQEITGVDGGEIRMALRPAVESLTDAQLLALEEMVNDDDIIDVS